MKEIGITLNKLQEKLTEISRVYGDLPILTLNQNDCSVVYDYILSKTMDITVKEITTINGKNYIKDSDYEEWLKDNVDENEEHFVEYISGHNLELRGIAKKVLLDEFIDEDWGKNWDFIHPILEKYYLTELSWERVIIITNYS